MGEFSEKKFWKALDELKEKDLEEYRHFLREVIHSEGANLDVLRKLGFVAE